MPEALSIGDEIRALANEGQSPTSLGDEISTLAKQPEPREPNIGDEISALASQRDIRGPGLVENFNFEFLVDVSANTTDSFVEKSYKALGFDDNQVGIAATKALVGGKAKGLQLLTDPDTPWGRTIVGTGARMGVSAAFSAGAGLFWTADRPYSSVISGLDAGMRGDNIAVEMKRGLTGEREGHMLQLMENLGADPHNPRNVVVGALLDMTAGQFLDPINYISFGSKALANLPMRSLRGARVLSQLDNVSDVARATDALQRARQLAQKAGDTEELARLASRLEDITKPVVDVRASNLSKRTVRALEEEGHIPTDRKEFAKLKLWGVLNVRVPFAPLLGRLGRVKQGGKVDDILKTAYEGVSITPQKFNEIVAKQLDVFESSLLRPLNDRIHSFVGGTRYFAERMGLRGEAFVSDANVRMEGLQEPALDVSRFMKELEETVPIEQRRNMTHLLEDPDVRATGEPITTRRILQETPEAAAARQQTQLDLIKSEAAVRNEFNKATQVELDAMRIDMDNWTESSRGLKTVSMDDLESFWHGNQNTGAAENAGSLHEAIVANQDVDLLEQIITEWAKFNRMLPDSPDTPRVAFKAYMGKQQFDEMAKRSSQRVGKEKMALANELDLAFSKKTKGGAKGEEFLFGQEFSSPEGAHIVFHVPYYSNLSEEFGRHFGGIGDIEKRKGAITNIMDALQANTTTGTGDTLSMVESYMRWKRGAPGSQFTKQARKDYLKATEWLRKTHKIDPDNKSLGNVLEAIYHRRVSYSAIPGDYSRYASMAADDILLQDVFSGDVAAMYVHTQEQLRRNLEIVDHKILALEQGKMPAAEFVPPEDMSPEDLKRLHENMDIEDAARERLSSLEREESLMTEMLGTDEHYAELDDELFAVRREIETHEMALRGLNDPIREVETRTKQRLLSERDDIIQQLQSPDTLQRAYYARKTLQEKMQQHTKRNIIHEERMADAGIDISDWSPEMREHFDRVLDIKIEAEDMYLSRLRKIDPDVKSPILNYVAHIPEEPRSALEKIRRGLGINETKKAVRNRLRKKFSGWTERKIELETNKEMQAAEARGRIGISKDEAAGDFDRLKQRTIKETLYTIQRSDFGPNFETDIARITNAQYSEAVRWSFRHDLVVNAVDKGIAKSFPKDTPKDVIRQAFSGDSVVQIDTNNIAPWVKKGTNPYENVWTTLDGKKLYDNMLNNHTANWTTDTGMRKVMWVFDALRRTMAPRYTVPYLPFHARNVVTDVQRAQMHGLRLDLTNSNVRRHFRAAAEITKSGDDAPWRVMPKNAQQMTKDGGGYKETLEKWAKMSPQEAALLTPENVLRYMHANVFDNFIREGAMELDRVGIEVRGPLRAYQKGELGKWVKNVPKNVAKSATLASPIGPSIETMPLVMWLQRRIGGPTQNHVRSWMFFDRVDQYMETGVLSVSDSFRAAEKDVRLALFDYGDLTEVEKTVFKNIDWWYAYKSKSWPFHFKKLLQDPRRYGPYYRAYNGLNAGFAYDRDDPDQWHNSHIGKAQPDFVRQQFGVQIWSQYDEEIKQDKQYYLLQEGWVSIADVNEVGEIIRGVVQFAGGYPTGGPTEEDVDRLARTMGSLTNPVLRPALEAMFKRDMQTGREIDASEMPDVFGVPLPRYVANLLRNYRLYNDMDRLNPGGAWTEIFKYYNKRMFNETVTERPHRNELDASGRISRAAVGVRAIEVNPTDRLEKQHRRIEYEVADLKRQIDSLENAPKPDFASAAKKRRIIEEVLTPKAEEVWAEYEYWSKRNAELEAGKTFK